MRDKKVKKNNFKLDEYVNNKRMKYWYNIILTEDESYGIPDTILDEIETDLYVFWYKNEILERDIIIWNPRFVNHNFIEVPRKDFETLDCDRKIGIRLKKNILSVKKLIIKPLDWGFYELENPKISLENGLKDRIGISVGDEIKISEDVRVEIRMLYDNDEDEILWGKILNSDIEVDFFPIDNYDRIKKEKEEERLEKEKERIKEMLKEADKLAENAKVYPPGAIVFGRSRNLIKKEEPKYFTGKGRKLNE
jgi:hypothetical protein